MEKGANIQAETNKGQTALDLAESESRNWLAAEKEGLAKTIKLLKECQQKVDILNLDSL